MSHSGSHSKSSAHSHEQALTLELALKSDDWRPVFVAGNFNGWTVGESRCQMRKTGENRYVYTFPSDIELPETIEYRYYKGGKENVELDEKGEPAPIRVAASTTGRIKDTVSRWSSYGLTYQPAHRPLVEVLVDSFDIPQLGRTRRIWAVLPHDYYHSEKHYPVLYLQDAQNLLGEGVGFGSWRIEDKLAALSATGSHQIIIIAIEHGEKNRINEFLPFATIKFGKGSGRDYIRFLSDTLKPYVDANLRTLPDRLHTGIGGSSLGGLISIYAGLLAPASFSRFLIFSPSLWIAQHVPFNHIHLINAGPTRIYLYGGGKEGSNMVDNVESFRNSFKKKGLDASQVAIHVSIDPSGQHREARWGEEFPKALKWLYFEK